MIIRVMINKSDNETLPGGFDENLTQLNWYISGNISVKVKCKA